MKYSEIKPTEPFYLVFNLLPGVSEYFNVECCFKFFDCTEMKIRQIPSFQKSGIFTNFEITGQGDKPECREASSYIYAVHVGFNHVFINKIEAISTFTRKLFSGIDKLTVIPQTFGQMAGEVARIMGASGIIIPQNSTLFRYEIADGSLAIDRKIEHFAPNVNARNTHAYDLRNFIL